jgi:RNA polymerase sigma-70 factor (ECF subfamily)
MKQSIFISQVQQFEAKMYRLACRILISKDASKDAVQEVLLKLWEKINEDSKVKSMEAYAMQMTKNHCYDQLKLKANQHLRIVHQNFEGEIEEIEDSTQDEMRIQLIKEAIKDLPEQQKMVMQLRDIENYSFTEIAEILEITEVAARVNLSRARKSIIKKMKNEKKYEIQA